MENRLYYERQNVLRQQRCVERGTVNVFGIHCRLILTPS